MELKFRVFAYISKPVHEVFEAVADPAKLSQYFTTGGAQGRLDDSGTVADPLGPDRAARTRCQGEHATV